MSAPRAVQFINYKDDDSGQLEVQQEAIDILLGLKGPVGCIAVCGRSRTGKSFILNQLLGKAAGFKVGPTYKPCTRGIWIWSDPVQCTNPDGSTYNMVLLDTEGVDSYDQTTQEGVQVFSLALLLSSMFVYNQMGGIDEAALDRLSLITELTRHIRARSTPKNGKAGSGRQEEQELAGFAPSFLWLLRDFYLDLDDNGRTVSPREYLETALMPSWRGKGPAITAKNEVRESIKALFPERDCITLVRPAHDEADLRDLDSLPPARLRPEFRQGVADLVDKVWARAAPKVVGREGVLTGRVLAGLAVQYVASINQGAIPVITSAWQVVAEAECRRAVEEGVKAYAAAFSEATDPEEGPLLREHQKALKAALGAFKEAAVGSEAVRGQHQEALEAACEARLAEVTQRVQAAAAADVDYQLYRGASYLSTVGRTAKSWEAMEAELARVVADFQARTKGPLRWPRLVEFCQQQYAGAAADRIAQVEAAAEARVREMQAQVEQLKVSLDASRLETQAARQAAAERPTYGSFNGHGPPRSPPPREAGVLDCMPCLRANTYKH